MKILGISGLYHDAAAALIMGGEIIAAAEEERFTRKKHDKDFPIRAIEYCLTEGNIKIDDLDAIAFYERPSWRIKRMFNTFIHYAPQGMGAFISKMPSLLYNNLFFKQKTLAQLQKIQSFDASKVKFLFPEHHLSHAASVFYPSYLEESAILTIDGVGEYTTAAIYHGKGNQIKVLKELHFPHSVGLLYSAFTEFLGFMVNNGEYKVMGLAPYGMLDSDRVDRFVELTKKYLVHIADDGSIRMDQSYFIYATGGGIINKERWEALFGLPMRGQDTKLDQVHCDLALAIQLVTEEVVLKMAKEAKRLTASKNICLSGGVALNCVANGKLLKTNLFENIYIQPASSDAGGSLGAALAANYLFFKEKRLIAKGVDQMKGAYLGPDFKEQTIKALIAKHQLVYDHYPTESGLSEAVAQHIADGNVIGWFQGRMEFGPRALGNRSILGDATNPKMQSRINTSIKFREDFRPFAPSVLEEDAAHYFDLDVKSPYMLLVVKVKDEHINDLPENYEDLQWRKKLDVARSDLQSITHINFSARIHTVTPEVNRPFYELIKAFKSKTDYGVLINTSFNVRGEPIVCTPEDAYNCFMHTNMDYLVLHNYVFAKQNNTK